MALFSKRGLALVFSLTKIKIAMLVTLTAAMGYLLAAEQFSWHLFVPVVAVFLLAGGASALNEYQDRDYDRLMKRTQERPIPAGELSPWKVLGISWGLIAVALGLLGWGTSLPTLGWGIAAVVWYNGVYTYLKRQISWAIIPGAIIGAIAPILGWVAAGGKLWHPQLMAIATFLFIWQIPHFWLILLRYGKQYEAAGYPTLTASLSASQLARLTFVGMWIATLVALTIPFCGPAIFYPTVIALSICTLWLWWKARGLLRTFIEDALVKPIFHGINIYAFLVICVLSADKIARYW